MNIWAIFLWRGYYMAALEIKEQHGVREQAGKRPPPPLWWSSGPKGYCNSGKWRQRSRRWNKWSRCGKWSMRNWWSSETCTGVFGLMTVCLNAESSECLVMLELAFEFHWSSFVFSSLFGWLSDFSWGLKVEAELLSKLAAAECLNCKLVSPVVRLS